MRFRLVPKSPTLGDLELLYKFKFSRNFPLLRIFGRQQRSTAKRMKIEPHCQLHTESRLTYVNFNDV